MPAYHYGDVVEVGMQTQSSLLANYYKMTQTIPTSPDEGGLPLAGIAGLAVNAVKYHNISVMAKIGFGVDLKLPQSNSSTNVDNLYDVLDLENALASAIGLARLPSPIVRISTDWDNDNNPPVAPVLSVAAGSHISVSGQSIVVQSTEGNWSNSYTLSGATVTAHLARSERRNGSAGAASFSQATSLIDAATGRSYFDEAQVWIDADQDGATDAGELHGLAELGIASIDLAAQRAARRP